MVIGAPEAETFLPHYLSCKTAVLYTKRVFFVCLEPYLIHHTVLYDGYGLIHSEVLSQPIYPIKEAAGSDFYRTFLIFYPLLYVY